jgi:hypothetical protein
MRIFIVLLLVLACKILPAQDTIVMKNGDLIVAKIIEVNESSVKYKKFSYQEGPLFIISIERIAEIRYADGSKDTFAGNNSKPSEARDSSLYGRNLLSLNATNFLFGNVSLSYEHFGKKGNFGLRIPVYIAYSETRSSMTGAAVDFKFYLGKPGKARYYLGPSLIGFADYIGYVSGGLMFDNGVLFQPFPMLAIGIDGAIGPAHYSSYDTAAFLNGVVWRAGIDIGIRF